MGGCTGGCTLAARPRPSPAAQSVPAERSRAGPRRSPAARPISSHPDPSALPGASPFAPSLALGERPHPPVPRHRVSVSAEAKQHKGVGGRLGASCSWAETPRSAGFRGLQRPPLHTNGKLKNNSLCHPATFLTPISCFHITPTMKVPEATCVPQHPRGTHRRLAGRKGSRTHPGCRLAEANSGSAGHFGHPRATQDGCTSPGLGVRTAGSVQC